MFYENKVIVMSRYNWNKTGTNKITEEAYSDKRTEYTYELVGNNLKMYNDTGKIIYALNNKATEYELSVMK